MNLTLLKEILETGGAPGFEHRIRKLVIDEVTPLVDEISVDNLGNVVGVVKGKNNPNGKKVMVAAHMDEIGFIVNYIDANGFVRFHPLGGFDPKTLTAQRVIIHGRQDVVGVMGSKPIHMMKPAEKGKAPEISDFYIDLGMSKEEVEQVIAIGDPITREREMIEMGNCINCKSLDNRISVFTLIETLKRLEQQPLDVYAVFTVQEEVGLRGAHVASHSIDPDFGIALDVTIAYDVPGGEPHESITRLGQGPAVKILDGSVICDYRMVAYMKSTADRHGIKWQPEILPAGGTDTAPLQRMSINGTIAGALSLPTRHLHQVIEMANKDDIENFITLLLHLLHDLDQYNWDHQYV